MINPKYDLDNYIKHLAIPVITDNQKLDKSFRSYLLRVKWTHNPLNRQRLNNIGILRVHVQTPFGKLRPQDYQCQVDTAKDTYIQFVTLSPAPDFDYQIEVIQPVGITRSMLEIWEYIEPTNYTNNNMSIHQPTNNADIIEAMRVNTIAEIDAARASNQAVIESNLAEILYTVETRFNATIEPQLVAAGNQLRRGLMISTTCANHIYRFYSSASAFTDLTYLCELVGANAQWELPEGMCRSQIWMSCDTTGMALADQPVDVVVLETLVQVAEQNA